MSTTHEPPETPEVGPPSGADDPAPGAGAPAPDVESAAPGAGEPPSGVAAGARGATAGWSPARRAGFRFAFAYLVLYSFPFPIGMIPGTDWPAEQYSKLWDAIIPWVGAHVLGISREIPTGMTGSGDRTYDYILLLCNGVLAALAAIVWSAAEARRRRRPRDDAKLYGCLRVYVRYVLGFTLLSYGFAKLFKAQFPTPSPGRLLQPYGDSSPMGLLWTFMGYSAPYTIFSGAAEVIPGALLFFRRTTTLGALLAAAVLGNVVMLNFCYDVPVKLYSSHLVLMSLFLMLPDLGRLANVFLWNRTARPAELGRPFASPRMNRAALAVKVLFLGFALYATGVQAYEGMMKYGDGAPRHPLFGVYEVEAFTLDGQALPPLLTEPRRWRRAAVSNSGRFSVKLMDDSTQNFRLTEDAEKKTLELANLAIPDQKQVLAYTKPDGDHLTLEGPFMGASISVRLRRIDASHFELMSRGFRWINETPYNK
jgi:hypothetical protein